VVGSKNSSNSVRLTEIAEATGTPAVLIDDKTELDEVPDVRDRLSAAESVLVTAGASAPEDLVESLMLHLIETYGGEVEQHDIFNEYVEFGLPGTLKHFMRDRGIDPSGRRITMDNAASIARWLSEHEIPFRTVDLTVGATP
jgi:4-hydroxy-3-methylbut-2-enyl diphosphate reductase